MTQRSHFRGHPILWTGSEWRYADTLEPLPATGGSVRPCALCGLQTPLGEGEVDPCLGVLPGVDNACCGHGVRDEAYVRFTTGVVLKGFTVERP
jgi:hypothetical protein